MTNEDVEGFDAAVERYHQALDEFVKGNHEPVMELFSQRENVVLCNPFVPFARGSEQVVQSLERAASHFEDGEVVYENMAKYATPEVGYIIEAEQFRAKLDGREGSGALRSTNIFRREDGVWKVVHRHADPITTVRTVESMLQT